MGKLSGKPVPVPTKYASSGSSSSGGSRSSSSPEEVAVQGRHVMEEFVLIQLQNDNLPRPTPTQLFDHADGACAAAAAASPRANSSRTAPSAMAEPLSLASDGLQHDSSVSPQWSDKSTSSATSESLQEAHTHAHRVGLTMARIADEFNNDPSINGLIARIPPSADGRQTFFTVLRELFADGVVNWGRVTAVFYIGYRLIARALDDIPTIQSIMDWVTTFVRDNLAEWIVGQGGWDAMAIGVAATPNRASYLPMALGVAALLAVCAFVIMRRR